jgi:hypothetical protein
MKWQLASDEITGEEHKKRVDKLFNDLSRKVKES